MFKRLRVNTDSQVEFVDITSKTKNIVKESNTENGILILYVPHTTAAITINENADPTVKSDILNQINKTIPFKDNYKHREGNSAAHIKTSIFGSSETIIINNNNLVLGRWQGIYLCEFDGPRTRKVNIKIIDG